MQKRSEAVGKSFGENLPKVVDKVDGLVVPECERVKDSGTMGETVRLVSLPREQDSGLPGKF